MFAVVKTGGKQYRMIVDQRLQIERLAGEVGDVVALSEVLLVEQEGKAVIGKPYVAGAEVSVEILAQNRAPKVIAFKKRRRQNSKRTRGHRQELSTVRVVAIKAS